MPRAKSRILNFRVTEQDHQRIHRRAEKAGLSLSGYLLTMALDGKLIITPGLAEAAHELRKIGNNINQLTRLCHEGKITCPDLQGVKQAMEEIWRSLSSPTPKAG
jgi:hypothetical protein